MGKVMMPLRLCLAGELKGPDVPDIMQILGKEPEYLMNISTIVGMSAGIGSVAVSYIWEEDPQ